MERIILPASNNVLADIPVQQTRGEVIKSLRRTNNVWDFETGANREISHDIHVSADEVDDDIDMLLL